MLKAYIVAKALIKDKDLFLILKTSESNQNNDLSGWETPGGHLEINENILDSLKREVLEETGLSIEIFHAYNAFISNIDKLDTTVGINYFAKYTGGDIKIDRKEHSKYKWATISEIRELKDSVGLQKEIDAYEEFISINIE